MFLSVVLPNSASNSVPQHQLPAPEAFSPSSPDLTLSPIQAPVYEDSEPTSSHPTPTRRTTLLPHPAAPSQPHAVPAAKTRATPTPASRWRCFEGSAGAWAPRGERAVLCNAARKAGICQDIALSPELLYLEGKGRLRTPGEAARSGAASLFSSFPTCKEHQEKKIKGQ